MREHNERLVLTLIRRHGPTAKADIARATGLSAQTVSVIMRELEAAEFLVRGDPVRGRVGQPSIPMALAPEGAFFFGLKVGRRSLELVLTDFLGAVRQRIRKTHGHPMPDDTVRFARQSIEKMMSGLSPRDRGRVAGLGIAMPFRMWDWAEDLAVPQDQMDAWRDADLQAMVAAHFDFPVFLQNDATAACGAELVFGANETPRDFLHFYVGYFIGGGVVLNGALYAGPGGNAGALGSLPVPGRGPDAEHAQLIDVASLSLLESRLVSAGHADGPIWATPEGLEVDPPILADWIDEAASGIAHAIVSAIAVIDFGAVMIDGWITPSMRTRLVQAVRHHLARRNLAGLVQPEIREGSIGADARALGAASLPLSDRYLVETSSLQKTG